MMMELLAALDFLPIATLPDTATFWGWGPETWTAVGTIGATIVALTVSIVGAFSKSIKAWRRKPRLKLLVNRLSEHSELVSVAEEAFWQLRLPIKNNGWRGAATNVEVFLSSIGKESDGDSFTSPTYLPIRLHWSHAGGPICERIPAGIYRLLDFAKISPSTLALTFDTEIPRVNEDLVLSSGSYTLQIIVAAEHVTKRYGMRVRIEGQPVGLAALTDLFSVELI
jgi:hypothetical protein